MYRIELDYIAMEGAYCSRCLAETLIQCDFSSRNPGLAKVKTIELEKKSNPFWDLIMGRL